MSANGDPHSEIIEGKVYVPREAITDMYAELALEAGLTGYLAGGYFDDTPLVNQMGIFADRLSEIAMHRGEADLDLIRFGLDYLTNNMNEVCSARYGYEPVSGLREQWKIAHGTAAPRPHRYVSGLNDRYWAQQFSEEYISGALAQRLPEENDQRYLGRYIHQVIHRFIYSSFSYMPWTRTMS